MVNRVADNLKLSTRLSTQVYNDKNIYNHSQSLSTTSIMNRQLLRQKVRQKISVIKTNTYLFLLSSRQKVNKMPTWTIFVLSSQVFVLNTEIFWRTFWRNNWRSIIDVVERLRYYFTDQISQKIWQLYY